MSTPSKPATPGTPRAQVGRVMVGTVLGILLGAGPALAWDLSTAPPPKPKIAAGDVGRDHHSVWTDIGKGVVRGAREMARAYLPHDDPPPEYPTTDVQMFVSPPIATPSPTPMPAPPPPPPPVVTF